MRAQFLTVNGLRTRWLEGGQGPALVLVHPVGYPADVFVRTIAGLESHCRVIAPDLLGQGFTDRPEKWTAAPQVMMADHVTRLTRELGIDRFSVLGSSLGGLVAALMALRDPTRIESLILVGTGSVFNEPSTQRAMLKQVYANGSRVYADPSLATMRDRIRNTCHVDPHAQDVLLATMTAYALPGMADAYRAIIEGLSASLEDRGATAFHHLEQIRARTLVIVGMNDVRTSFEAHAAGVKRMPNATITRIEDCGHLPFLERPAEFNLLLQTFLLSPSDGTLHGDGRPQRA